MHILEIHGCEDRHQHYAEAHQHPKNHAYEYTHMKMFVFLHVPHKFKGHLDTRKAVWNMHRYPKLLRNKDKMFNSLILFGHQHSLNSSPHILISMFHVSGILLPSSLLQTITIPHSVLHNNTPFPSSLYRVTWCMINSVSLLTSWLRMQMLLLLRKEPQHM